MKAGRVIGSKRWHLLDNDGHALCYPALQFEEERDSSEVNREDFCGNCDGRLAEKGSEQRKRLKAKRDRRTVYSPRFKFEE